MKKKKEISIYRTKFLVLHFLFTMGIDSYLCIILEAASLKNPTQSRVGARFQGDAPQCGCSKLGLAKME